jgi:hypothetical protein
MKYVSLGLFIQSGTFLGVAATNRVDELIPPHIKEAYGPLLSGLEEDCRELEFVAALATVKRLRELLSGPTCTFNRFAELARDLQSRASDETLYRCCFSLSMEETESFEKWWKGWEDIIQRFKDATRDIEEMKKCFALERYTASMFHALHVAEWGAIELGNYIGVTDPKKGWRPTEKKLRELIRAGHSALPVQLAGKFEFLEQVSREIDSMVLAWRHKVDHAANHLAIVPNTEFTPDIARHIIGAVRIFMLRLVEGMP